MNKKDNSIQISMEEVAFIFNNNLNEFDVITSCCYCRHCSKNGNDSTIINYTIRLNNLNDLVLNGFCAKCNNEIGRYIETGDMETTAKNAQAVRETITALKELKIKRSR